MGSDLRVLFLAAEADPFVKVGGLGDVAGSLPLALGALDPTPDEVTGLDVRLAVPLHGHIDRKRHQITPLTSFTIPSRGGEMAVEVSYTESSGLPVYFIGGAPVEEHGPVYSDDPQVDGRKFVFFSLAALALMKRLNWQPSILHANDWHTAPAVYWLGRQRDADDFFGTTASLMEVHNLPYLGFGSQTAMDEFGLPPAEGSGLPEWANHLPLPLGLYAADHIVTVSPGYAGEILTPSFGAGLDEFLKTRADKVSGILNGIDEEQWNPATDDHIPSNYSISSLPFRSANKAALQNEVRLPVNPDIPLIGMVSRFVHQKGVDLALEALRQIAGIAWQAVLLGTGEEALEAEARLLEDQFPDRVRSLLLFDPAFSRRIYAGADAILIPSRYEPSGLTQMIGMRYGCVPIGRATGGLIDSIKDYQKSNTGTGFLFKEPDPAALAESLRQALAAYHDKRRWQGIQRRGMREEFSWARSAWKYYGLYRMLLENLPNRVGNGRIG